MMHDTVTVPLASLRLLESLSRDTFSNSLTPPDFLQLWGCTTFCQGDCDRTMLQCLVRRPRILLGRDASGQSCMGIVMVYAPTLIGMLCSQISFVAGNMTQGVFVVLVDRRTGESPPNVDLPKGLLSVVFEIASLAVVTATQDEDGRIDMRRLSASLSACRGRDRFICS